MFDIWGLSSKAKRAKKLAKVTIIFVGYGKQYATDLLSQNFSKFDACYRYEKTKDSLEPPVIAEHPPCDPP